MQCIYGDFDIVEFKHRWDTLVCDFGLEDNNWILYLNKKRKMWATTHIHGNFLLVSGQPQGMKVCTVNLVNMLLFYQSCMIFYNKFFVG